MYSIFYAPQQHNPGFRLKKKKSVWICARYPMLTSRCFLTHMIASLNTSVLVSL